MNSEPDDLGIPPRRVLVAGCGYVGTALAERLAARGDQVWGLRRRVDLLPRGVLPLAADLGDPVTLADLPPALDAVVYAAAADAGTEAAYRQAYSGGIANILAALDRQDQRPDRVIFTSSTAVYGQRDGEWVDENSAAEPAGFGGAQMLGAEATLRAGPFRSVVLRLGGIYGPGKNRLLDQVRRGEAACPPGASRWTNRIHRDDCAGALLHLLDLPDPEPLYLGVDCDPADRCIVVRWLAGQLGAPEPPVAESPRSGRGDGNKRCSNARLRASGYRFVYPSFRDGYAEMLATAGDAATGG